MNCVPDSPVAFHQTGKYRCWANLRRGSLVQQTIQNLHNCCHSFREISPFVTNVGLVNNRRLSERLLMLQVVVCCATVGWVMLVRILSPSRSRMLPSPTFDTCGTGPFRLGRGILAIGSAAEQDIPHTVVASLTS